MENGLLLLVVAVVIHLQLPYFQRLRQFVGELKVTTHLPVRIERQVHLGEVLELQHMQRRAAGDGQVRCLDVYPLCQNLLAHVETFHGPAAHGEKHYRRVAIGHCLHIPVVHHLHPRHLAVEIRHLLTLAAAILVDIPLQPLFACHLVWSVGANHPHQLQVEHNTDIVVFPTVEINQFLHQRKVVVDNIV